LAEAARREFKGELVVRPCPLASRATMGGVERWHQAEQGHFRALKSELEKQTGLLLTDDMAICHWLVRHASWTLHRYQVPRSHGDCAYRRVLGSDYSGRIVSFGEMVLALRQADSQSGGPRRQSKFNDRWSVGCWLGKTESSDEHVVCLTKEKALSIGFGPYVVLRPTAVRGGTFRSCGRSRSRRGTCVASFPQGSWPRRHSLLQRRQAGSCR